MDNDVLSQITPPIGDVLHTASAFLDRYRKVISNDTNNNEVISLPVICKERKGYVIGGLRYKIQQCTGAVDCNSERSPLVKCRVGQLIYRYLDRVVDMQGDDDLLFILYAGKHSTYSWLAQWNFHNLYRCLIITGEGKPELETKLFLKRVANELRLPVFCVVDCDVNDEEGLGIYTQLKYGKSVNRTCDGLHPRFPRLFYLGVSAFDLELLGCRGERINVKEHARITSYQAQDWVQQDPVLMSELTFMGEIKLKATAEEIDNVSPDRFALNYLPGKLYKVMSENMDSMV